MGFRRVLSVLFVSTCWLVQSLAEDPPPTNSSGSSAAPKPAVTTPGRSKTTVRGGSNSTKEGGALNGLGVDSSMIQRALYVLIAITIIGVLYFLIRAVRLKKPAQRKKYGLLSNYDDSVEMEAVESEDDDTLYEARSLRR